MKLLLYLSALGVTASAVELEQCERHVELVILQDASSSFMHLIAGMPELTESLVGAMTDKLGVVHSTVASFIDKPIPGRGIGDGRGYPAPLDYCYRRGLHVGLSDNFNLLAESYGDLMNHLGNGGDNPEAMHEAFVYAALDPAIGWSAPGTIYDEEGRRLVKVILMVTDDLSHMAGDEWDEAIEWWNKANPPNSGGYQFWDENFIDSADFYNLKEDIPKYQELRDLYIRGYKNLSREDKARYDELYALLGPDEYPIPKPHPYTFEAHKNCSAFAYAEPSKVGKVLREAEIVPIVAISSTQRPRSDTLRICRAVDSVNAHKYAEPVTEEAFKECLMNAWKIWMKHYGVEHYLLTWFTPQADQLVEKIVESVDKITRDVSCPVTTTSPPSTTESTHEVTTTPETVKTDFSSGTYVVSSNVAPPLTATNSVTHTGTHSITVSASESSKQTLATEDTTDPNLPSITELPPSTETTEEECITDSEPASEPTTTENAGIPPPIVDPPEKQGAGAGVVAGATGGAAAGAALIGGVLYKQFGMSLLGGNATPDLQGIDQVDVPETPMERECREEVTMDMFQ